MVSVTVAFGGFLVSILLRLPFMYLTEWVMFGTADKVKAVAMSFVGAFVGFFMIMIPLLNLLVGLIVPLIDYYMFKKLYGADTLQAIGAWVMLIIIQAVSLGGFLWLARLVGL